MTTTVQHAGGTAMTMRTDRDGDDHDGEGMTTRASPRRRLA
jgi:hypothetical protein